jgi:hypothetical protein
LLFCLFSQAAAVDGQPEKKVSFVDTEAQPDSEPPAPTAPVFQALQEGASASWANYRKPYSSFSAQAVQPQADQAAQPIRCILVDDPEAGTVFGETGGPVAGSVAHVELTTSQVKKEVKKLVKLAKEQLQKLSYSEGRLMMHKPSMSDFLRQLRQNIAAGACFTFLFLGECCHFLLLGNPILCTLCLPFHCLLLCCTALLQTCFCQKEEQWGEEDEYEEE